MYCHERGTLMKKFLARILVIILVVASLSGVVVMTINNHIVSHSKDKIIYTDSGNGLSPDGGGTEKLREFNADCILVLGAGIKDRETPSDILKDRLDTGIELYKNGIAPKLLLTGDNGDAAHNEIHAMLTYALEQGVPEEDIFCDHAGFSTYDSMYRSQSIFQVEKAVVVTQTYHEYRSLYIGEKLGIDVIGAASDQEEYSGQPVREIREVLARNKDFFKCYKKPAALYGGEEIPISGSGVVSHGE